MPNASSRLPVILRKLLVIVFAGVSKRRIVAYACLFGGALLFCVAVFVGNPREFSWRVLALAGWVIAMVGMGMHFYETYHVIKKKLPDLPDNFEDWRKQ
jgi:hypothetical protein